MSGPLFAFSMFATSQFASFYGRPFLVSSTSIEYSSVSAPCEAPLSSADAFVSTVHFWTPPSPSPPDQSPARPPRPTAAAVSQTSGAVQLRSLEGRALEELGGSEGFTAGGERVYEHPDGFRGTKAEVRDSV